MVSTPTAIVRMADAGAVYISWRWADDVLSGGVGVVPEADVVEAIRELTAALPNPSAPDSLERTLTLGALGRYDAEAELAQLLSRTFLPYALAAQLHDLMANGVRPHVRIQPSPRTAQVPWELIAPDPDVRLVEIADVSLLPPVSVTQAPGRQTRDWASTKHLPIVAVLDPKVPGFRADSILGSVLGRPDSAMPVAVRMATHAEAGRLRPAVTDPIAAFRRSDVDRDWLGEVLRAGAGRLLYIGHVTAALPESGQSELAELHLACTDSTTGFAQATRSHRPLSARDLLLGTYTIDANPVAGQELWPMPSRVALIACESGGDGRFSEALGLVSALIRNGAELVTASRWSLPTDLAFTKLAGAASGARPLQEAICAIDAAHDDEDPVRSLGSWQRERLAVWRELRTPEVSPILWGAIATVLAN